MIDVIRIDNQGNGFGEAIAQAAKAAEFAGLDHRDSLLLQLFTEEMLAMARSVTGEMTASFWVETEGRQFDLCLTTKTVMDKEKRYLLISSSTSRKNEAAKGFLGRLRDSFEQAMAADVEKVYFQFPADIPLSDLPAGSTEEPEWDRYERSVLLKIADNVKIDIRGGSVRMTVQKDFS